MANWDLHGCCNHNQIVFLATVGAFIFAIFALWRTPILTPFKLITVFLHEASHAIACLLTCGRVEGIKVNANEGGATITRGGMAWLILPAGYLGSSFWGMVLVLSSTDTLTAQIAAACLAVALLMVLFIAKNWFLRGLCIGKLMIIVKADIHLIMVYFLANSTFECLLQGFLVFIAVIWILQVMTTVRILRYVILFVGIMNSMFSVYDIYDDLISRRVHSSDAEKFAEICPCPCNGLMWGVIWGLISFILLCASVYLALVILA